MEKELILSEHQGCGCSCGCGHKRKHENEHGHEHAHTHGHDHSHEPVKWKSLAFAGVFALTAEILELTSADIRIIAGLSAAAILLSGLATYISGWKSLLRLDLNINALMAIAVTGAVIIGHWPEAAMVMVLFTLAEAIEDKASDKARHAVKNLLSLAPETATVQMSGGSWREINVKEAAPGSRVRVRPGERIALDGKIVSGSSAVNQAPVTGESMPVEKTKGDPVFAGTINESGSFEYISTAAASDSTLARIIRAVESAQGSRAPTQRFIDKFARIYTPAVFITALLTALVPPLTNGSAWPEWIYKGLIILVIACPCALVISTPVSIVSGLAAAARRGILVKGGLYLEQGRKLTLLALDKTGTLTRGMPVLTDFIITGAMDRTEAAGIAAGLAARSDHPVSKAVLTAARTENIPAAEVSDFSAVPGRGIQGKINGRTWYLGNHRLIEELGRCSKEAETRLNDFESQGKTAVMLISENGAEAVFAVADTVKKTSAEAVAELKKLGLKTVVLTGDNERTAAAAAAEVGADEVFAGLLPEDKMREIERMSQTRTVGMAGDGINDAPALAKADISFAMGAAGTDTAIETADVALMDDDLRKIPAFIRLSKSTHAVLVQNITAAIGVKTAFLILTFFSMTNMWMAVFADIGITLLVIANSLRLLKK